MLIIIKCIYKVVYHEIDHGASQHAVTIVTIKLFIYCNDLKHLVFIGILYYPIYATVWLLIILMAIPMCGCLFIFTGY